MQTSTHICCAARETAGKLCGIVMAAVQPAAAEQMLQELLSGFSDQDIKKHKFELQDGYMAATGYILAQCLTGQLPAVISSGLHSVVRLFPVKHEAWMQSPCICPAAIGVVKTCLAESGSACCIILSTSLLYRTKCSNMRMCSRGNLLADVLQTYSVLEAVATPHSRIKF